MTTEPKLRILALSCAGLVLLWFVPAAVWIAMPVWLVAAGALLWKAPADDWLTMPLAGLPFWWASGLSQYAIPVLGGIGVIGAALSNPIRGQITKTWQTLGAEKWFAVAAFGSMLPSVLVVTGGGRYFTYVRTVGLIGVSLTAMLLTRVVASDGERARRMLRFVVALAGTIGLWTLAQLVYKGSIHLPLQRTASLLELLPGKAGTIAARGVAEAAGIKYENIGGGTLVVRPHAFFVHAVVTGAVAGLLGPMIWRRIRHMPVWRLVVSGFFAYLIGTALVASLARGAYIGIAGAVPAAIVVFWPQIRKLEWKRVVPAVVAGIAVAGAIGLTRGSEAKARNQSKLAEGSFVSRAAYYRATWRDTFNYPLFGHGTQRDNIAAPLAVKEGTPIVKLKAGTTETVFGEGRTIVVVRTQPGTAPVRLRFTRNGGKPIDEGPFSGRIPSSATTETFETDTESAVESNAAAGIITVHKLKGGRQERLYYGPSVPPGAPKSYVPPADAPIVQRAKLISAADRDPPLGSHSTILGISYKYGLIGLAAFMALWAFVGLAPLRRLRTESAPMLDDARALWIGILAFGLQLPIYEYDFDSTSPYLFYLLCGLLLGLSVRRAPVESAAP